MQTSDYVSAYIKASPFSIFDSGLAARLAQTGWDKLTREIGIGAESYSTANCLTGTKHPICCGPRLRVGDAACIMVEAAEVNRLQSFYDEHGLEPLTDSELGANQAQLKLQRALALLDTVAPVAACVKELVRTIQVLRQDDAEIDTSYSHPDLPFSIFVSVCEDDSLLSSLRVAESILHETMHLQLTLLEGIVDLVQPGSTSLYFSPWREENRPIRGVLHGLYVFRAIRDFYIILRNGKTHIKGVYDFLLHRIESIESEIGKLTNFDLLYDLTYNGQILSHQLLNKVT